MEENYFLPNIAKKNRIIPNDIIRSSLFTISNHNRQRGFLKNHAIHTFGNTHINYTGEELRQDDEDVWLQLVFLASQLQSEVIDFMPYRFLSQIGWPQRTQYREKLKSTLERMSATNVDISNKSIKAGISLSLVRKFVWFNNSTNVSLKQWKVWLEPELVKLFSINQYTKVDWEQRKQLSPLSKWLHSYYSSHAEPMPITIHTLKKACGSKMKAFKHFKASLRKALQDLVKIGFLETYFINAANVVEVKRHKKIFGYFSNEQ